MEIEETNVVNKDQVIFTCSTCSSTFRRKGSLNNHISRLHPKVSTDSSNKIDDCDELNNESLGRGKRKRSIKNLDLEYEEKLYSISKRKRNCNRLNNESTSNKLSEENVIDNCSNDKRNFQSQTKRCVGRPRKKVSSEVDAISKIVDLVNEVENVEAGELNSICSTTDETNPRKVTCEKTLDNFLGISSKRSRKKKVKEIHEQSKSLNIKLIEKDEARTLLTNTSAIGNDTKSSIEKNEMKVSSLATQSTPKRRRGRPSRITTNGTTINSENEDKNVDLMKIPLTKHLTEQSSSNTSKLEDTNSNSCNNESESINQSSKQLTDLSLNLSVTTCIPIRNSALKKYSANSIENETYNAINSDLINDQTPCLLKRVGRPKKNGPGISSVADDGGILEESACNLPKRVGRPKKSGLRHISSVADDVGTLEDSPCNIPKRVERLKKSKGSRNDGVSRKDSTKNIPKRVRRTKKLNASNSFNTVVDSNDLIIDQNNGHVSQQPKRRGRPPKHLKKFGSDPRGRIDGNCNEEITKFEMIKCACLMEFSTLNGFNDHVIRSHYGLARRFGDDRPFDKCEKGLVLKKTIRLIKKIKCLNENCSKSFTTAGGYLYHETVCGRDREERMVTCELCGKVLIAASVRSHNKAFHEEKPVLEIANEDKGAVKRTAAKKAEEMLLKISTEGKSGSISDVQDDDYKVSSDDESAANSEQDCKSDYGEKPKREKVRQKPVQANEDALLELWQKEINQSGYIKCRNELCHQEENSLNQMLSHYYKCRYRLYDVFMCPFDNFKSTNKETVVTHIAQNHSTEESAKLHPAKSLSIMKMPQIGCKDDSREHHRKGYTNFILSARRQLSQYLEFTKTFIKQNFSNGNSLFTNWLPDASNWKELATTEQEQVLPFLKQSTEFQMKHLLIKNSQTNNDSWKKLTLFESFNSTEEPISKIMFVGGPIKSFAWCPTSNYYHCRQFIALYCHQNPNSKHFSGNVNQQPCLIQIWDFGDLDNSSAAEMVLAIVDNSGAIWDLKWCPSGCYENISNQSKTLPRIGLLAAACSDGFIKLYSIPHPNSLTPENTYPVYKTSPVAILSLVASIDYKPQFPCTAMSWFEGKGHGFIAGGFSNGLVAVWDLKSKSSILMTKNCNGSKILAPFLTFRAHGNIVTGVDFCPHFDGEFIVTCSRDRTVKYWNLDDVTLPINSIKKRSMTKVRWYPNFCGAFTVSDNCFSMHYNGMVFIESNFIGEISGSAVSHRGSVLDISLSKWIKCVATCDDAGEVFLSVITDSRNAHSNYNYKKLPLYRCLLEEVCQGELKNEATVDQSLNYDSYENAIKKFKLLYMDVSLNRLPSLRSEELQKLSSINSTSYTNLDYFSLNSVNQVSWNPNLGSHQWLATGEQSGLLRLIKISQLDFVDINKVRQDLVE